MEELLSVSDLKVHFPIKKGIFSRITGHVHAVNGISFNLKKGESIGLVGESGCGKTTTGLAILRLIEPTSGKVIFDGMEMSRMTKPRLRSMRREMQIIFQDPFSSLNPRRIGIARALALNPLLIIGDEPVSALDVSIQAQIINLLIDLQQEFQLSYIIIAHDLAVVEHICDRVIVMYLGKIVEMASYRDLYINPKHPYTQALMSAVPKTDPRAGRDRIILKGDVPSPINPPPGCHFHPRCPHRMEPCDRAEPVLKDLGDHHDVACYLYGSD
jgi:oligopeptide/dipeptide ABC transporter ATP-binding protein